MFQTKMRESGDNKIIQRMVFYEITRDAFKWDWEMSADNGNTWTLQWRIFYGRVKISY